MAYVVLALAQVAEPSAYARLVNQLDFGVSAMQAAWLGAAAATLWFRWACSGAQRIENTACAA